MDTWSARYFSAEDVSHSATAIEHSIDNTAPAPAMANAIIAAVGMDRVRHLLCCAILVSSWFRCLKLNRLVGSADTSAHRLGWAIDFTSPKFGPPLAICRAIIAAGIAFDQLIYEGTWVHISFDPRMRGEVLTAHKMNGRMSYTPGLPH